MHKNYKSMPSDEEKERVIEGALGTEEGRKALADSMSDFIRARMRERSWYYDVPTMDLKPAEGLGAVAGARKCHCSRQQLMRAGCVCGGA